MKIFTKHSVLGFLLGAIVVPLILFAIFDYYINNLMDDSMELIPPKLVEMKSIDYNWSVKNMDGEKIEASDLFEDKIIFLNFWATWCSPCVAELPSIQKLYDKFGDRVTFACIADDKIGDINKLIKEKEYTFPVYALDSLPDYLDPESIPTTYIVSKDKVIKAKHEGGADWFDQSVIKFIEELLENE